MTNNDDNVSFQIMKTSMVLKHILDGMNRVSTIMAVQYMKNVLKKFSLTSQEHAEEVIKHKINNICSFLSLKYSKIIDR